MDDFSNNIYESVVDYLNSNEIEYDYCSLPRKTQKIVRQNAKNPL